MKILNGTDIVEIYRIRNCIEEYGEKFLQRIYTKSEIQYCESKISQKYASYAVRFAAKEAVYKAISSNLKTENVSWKDIEIINNLNGRPSVIVKKNIEKLDYIEISLSHSNEYAIANAIAVYKEI